MASPSADTPQSLEASALITPASKKTKASQSTKDIPPKARLPKSKIPKLESEMSADDMLLNAVFKQVEITGLDFKKIASDISELGGGELTENAARTRWSRFYKPFRDAHKAASDAGQTDAPPSKAVGAKGERKGRGAKTATTKKKGDESGEEEGMTAKNGSTSIAGRKRPRVEVADSAAEEEMPAESSQPAASAEDA